MWRPTRGEEAEVGVVEQIKADSNKIYLSALIIVNNNNNKYNKIQTQGSCKWNEQLLSHENFKPTTTRVIIKLLFQWKSHQRVVLGYLKWERKYAT